VLWRPDVHIVLPFVILIFRLHDQEENWSLVWPMGELALSDSGTGMCRRLVRRHTYLGVIRAAALIAERVIDLAIATPRKNLGPDSQH
jgi:hypothetical protein